jgi:hypothetical protein
MPSGGTTVTAPAPVTLIPQAPPNVDTAGTDVLTPQNISQLWFGGSSSASNVSNAVNAPSARLNVTFEYPSIVLDNSINIYNIECGSADLSFMLSASFNTTVAYTAAETSWAATHGSSSELILITAAPGCSSDGDYIYFVASSCDFDDTTQSVGCAGNIESIADIVQELGIDFGSILSSTTNVASNPELEVTYGCFTPSSTEINGLPALYCGPDFDERLDNQLGYYSGAASDFNVSALYLLSFISLTFHFLNARKLILGQATFAALAPGITPTTPDRRRMIQRRCFWGALCNLGDEIDNFASNIWSAATSEADDFGNNILSTAEGLFNDAESTVSFVGFEALHYAEVAAADVAQVVESFLTVDISHTFDFPVGLGPSPASLDDSPWGPAFMFYDWTPDAGAYYNSQEDAIDKIKTEIIGELDLPSIELWCVDCGIQGDFQMTASIKWSLVDGLTEGQLAMNGNLSASLFLGMNAFSEWNPTIEYDINTIGLDGICIGTAICIGPIVALGVSVDLDIVSVGQYLLGANLTWPDLSATLDFVDPADSTQSGWTPIVNDTVQADGSLTVNSTFGLPITLGYSLVLLDGLLTREIKLVDTPGIRASCKSTHLFQHISIRLTGT